MSAPHDPTALPEGLPVPEDDGACDHLVGMRIPSLVLLSTHGALDLGALADRRLVLYAYPRTGRPGVAPLPGWDAIPGARGCTPESCAFRDRHAELRDMATVAGLSAQTLEEQREFAERNSMPFPIFSDPELRLARALRLPTFEAGGITLYKRVTLIAEGGEIVKAFYPVFPPDTHADEVLTWLRGRGGDLPGFGGDDRASSNGREQRRGVDRAPLPARLKLTGRPTSFPTVARGARCPTRARACG